jgi:hypothetical protein
MEREGKRLRIKDLLAGAEFQQKYYKKRGSPE